MIETKKIAEITGFIQEFFRRDGTETLSAAEPILPANLPVWMKQAARFYRFPLGRLSVTLIIPNPNEEMTFDQVVNLYRVHARLGEGPSLVLADSLAPKSRGALVREGIPHVVSDHSIFAPELGIAYGKLPRESKPHFVRETLSPVGLTIIESYLLTDSFEAEETFTLLLLQKRLAKYHYATSMSTLSRACQQLRDLGLLQGAGDVTWRSLHFEDRDAVWKRLLESDIDVIARRTAGLYAPPAKASGWVYWGETALSRQTDLSEPQQKTIALSVSAYRKWEASAEQGRAGRAPNLTIEIWRDDPTFLAQGKCINPVSLALSLRRNTDPRVRIALTEVLKKHKLDADLLGELP